MKRVVFALAAVFFLIAIGIAAASPTLAADEASPAAVADEPQTPPPPGVSPKDPAVNPPDTDGWRCPRCGAALPRHAWGGKGAYGRPELGAGQGGHAHGWAQDSKAQAGRARPGRYGRAGDEQCCGMGPGHHKHGFVRGGVCRPGPRDGFPGRAMRGGRGAPGMGAGNPAERLLRNAEELKLTVEQVGALEKVSFETQKTLVDLHAQIEKEQLEIKNLLQSGTDDLAAVKVHLDAVSRARADVQTVRIENLFEARKILTEKQKKMIKEDFPRLGEMLD